MQFIDLDDSQISEAISMKPVTAQASNCKPDQWNGPPDSLKSSPIKEQSSGVKAMNQFAILKNENTSLAEHNLKLENICKELNRK